MKKGRSRIHLNPKEVVPIRLRPNMSGKDTNTSVAIWQRIPQSSLVSLDSEDELVTFPAPSYPQCAKTYKPAMQQTKQAHQKNKSTHSNTTGKFFFFF